MLARSAALLLSLACLAPLQPTNASATSPVQQSSPPGGGTSGAERTAARALIAIDFPGGTVAEYIAAIRRAKPDVNILMAPPLANVPFMPTTLYGVSVSSALNLLHNHRHTDVQAGIHTSIHFEMRTADDGGAPIFIIKADQFPTQSTRPEEPLITRVFSLATVTEHTEIGVILSAVETAASIGLEDRPAAELTLHESTSLLFVRAQAPQIQLIESTIRQMDPVNSPQAARRLSVEIQELMRTIERLQLHQQQLEAENARLKERLEQLMLSRPSESQSAASERP